MRERERERERYTLLSTKNYKSSYTIVPRLYMWHKLIYEWYTRNNMNSRGSREATELVY